MLLAIEATLGSSAPNIMQFDWSEMSDPDLYDGGTPGRQWYDADDFLIIKPYAKAHGVILTDWIRANIANGNIDTNAPIHLIGHSAGGFVATDCAVSLGAFGHVVDQITLLDTPFPDNFAIADYVDLGSKAELYLSEYGHLGNILPNDPSQGFYERSLDTPPGQSGVEDHNYAHDWFTLSTDAAFVSGFQESPFLSPDSFHGEPRGPEATPMQLLASATSASIQTLWLTNFATFGSVSVSNESYTIWEESNAGIMKTITLPVGSSVLEFRYRFLSGGDGDQLAVTWGSSRLLFVGVDGPASRATNIAVSVDLRDLDEQTEELVFKLLSRGNTNAVVEVSAISLGISDDPDLDGLSTTEEGVLGTDPLDADTDGDGLLDSSEVNDFLTSPVLADTDGDGCNDGRELQAGTSPTNSLDYLRITAIEAISSQEVSISWTSATNKLYRLKRAESLSTLRDDYWVLTNSVPAQVPTNTFIDASPTSAGPLYYWIEVE